MSQYHFPLKSTEELVASFKEVIPEIKLTENDFKNPNPDRIQRFYAFVLEFIGEVNMESLNQQQLKASEHFDKIEVHEESVTFSTFVSVLKCFMNACSVDDFNLTDITEPKPKRFQKMASAIVNFYVFKVQRMQIYEELKSENAAVQDRRNQLIRMNDEFKSKINAIQASRAEQEPALKELEDEIKEYNDRINAHKDMQSSLQKEICELKASNAEKKSNKAHIQSCITTDKEKNERLSKQIVQSPDRLRNDMERMRSQITSLTTSREVKLQRLIELKEQKDKGKELDANCEQGLKLITAIHAEIEKEREVLEENSGLSDQIASSKDELQELTTQEQQMKRKLISKRDKLVKMRLLHDKKMTSMQEEHAQLKQDYQKLAQIQNSDILQKETLEMEKRQIADETTKMTSEHNDIMNNMKSQYSKLLEELDIYHGRLADAWEVVSNTMKECDMTKI